MVKIIRHRRHQGNTNQHWDSRRTWQPFTHLRVRVRSCFLSYFVLMLLRPTIQDLTKWCQVVNSNNLMTHSEWKVSQNKKIVCEISYPVSERIFIKWSQFSSVKSTGWLNIKKYDLDVAWFTFILELWYKSTSKGSAGSICAQQNKRLWWSRHCMCSRTGVRVGVMVIIACMLTACVG